jgi:high-affinity Fe2+/Pb2+ permease
MSDKEGEKAIKKLAKMRCKTFRFRMGFILGFMTAIFMMVATCYILYYHYEPWKKREKTKYREAFVSGYRDGQFIIERMKGNEDPSDN